MSTQAILLKHIVEQTEGNIVSDMDSEKVMLNISKGKYYNLGEVGGRIWDLMKLPITVNDLVENLLSEYDVARYDCEIQVISFLNLLWKENLVKYRETIKL